MTESPSSESPFRSNQFAKRLRRIRSKTYSFTHQDDGQSSLPTDMTTSPDAYGPMSLPQKTSSPDGNGPCLTSSPDAHGPMSLPYEINGNLPIQRSRKSSSFESLSSVRPDDLLEGPSAYENGDTMVCPSRMLEYQERLEEDEGSYFEDDEKGVIEDDFELPPLEYQRDFLLEEIEEALPQEYSLKRKPLCFNSLTMYRAMLRLMRMPYEAVKCTSCMQQYQPTNNITTCSKEEELARLKVELLVQKTLLEQARKARAIATLAKYEDKEYLAAEKALLIAGLKCDVVEQEIKKLDYQNDFKPKADDLIGQACIKEFRITAPPSWETHYLVLVGMEGENVRCSELELDRFSGFYYSTTSLNFYNLQPDFTLDIQIYAIKMQEPKLSKKPFYRSTDRLALFQRQMKSSIGISNYSSKNNRHSRDLSYTNLNLLSGHNFALFGSCSVQLFHLKHNQLTFQTTSQNTVQHLQACVKGDVYFAVHYSGFLSVKHEIPDPEEAPIWIRYWFQLRETDLHGFHDPSHWPAQNPAEKMSLYQCTSARVEPVDKYDCLRPHTFSMMLRDGNDQSHRVLMAADSAEEMQKWCDRLNKALKLCRRFYIND